MHGSIGAAGGPLTFPSQGRRGNIFVLVIFNSFFSLPPTPSIQISSDALSSVSCLPAAFTGEGAFSLFSQVEFLNCSPGDPLKALGKSIFLGPHDSEMDRVRSQYNSGYRAITFPGFKQTVRCLSFANFRSITATNNFIFCVVSSPESSRPISPLSRCHS